MSKVVFFFCLLYLLLGVCTAGFLEQQLNRLPGGARRTNQIQFKILVAISFFVALLPTTWSLLLYSSFFDLKYLVGFLFLSCIFIVFLASEFALRSTGKTPHLEPNLFETSFESWASSEPHLGKDYVTVSFHNDYKNHYRRFKPKQGSKYMYATGSETGSITVSNQVRTTVGNFDMCRSSVHIIGGSTVFCAETPDHLTFASILQEKLNSISRLFKVINYGFSGATLPRLVERLQHTELQDTDVIVAYFGINESAHLMTSKFESVSAPFRFVPRYAQLIKILSEKSLMFEWLKNLTLKQAYKISNGGSSAVDSAIDSLIKLSEGKGIKLYLILQPNLLTKSTHTKYESEIIRRTSTEFRSAIRECYAKIEEILCSKSAPTVVSLCAVDVMDNCSQSPYLDLFHVNSDGNQLIANYIFGCLKRDNLLG